LRQINSIVELQGVARCAAAEPCRQRDGGSLAGCLRSWPFRTGECRAAARVRTGL